MFSFFFFRTVYIEIIELDDISKTMKNICGIVENWGIKYHLLAGIKI